MNKHLLLCAAVMATVLMTTACASAQPADLQLKSEATLQAPPPSSAGGALEETWNYTGAADPAHWADLSPAYATCGSGRSQSPIDLSGALRSNLAPLQPQYQRGATTWEYVDRTWQLTLRPGSVLSVGKHQYALKKVQFKRPSEHRINGMVYPMEIQFFHASAAGQVAIVAVLVKPGSTNPTAEILLKRIRHRTSVETRAKVAMSSPLSPLGLMPGKRDHFEYPGSLTVPPCQENVRWLVIKQPLSLSALQLRQFTEMMPYDNARPVQPLNNRAILD